MKRLVVHVGPPKTATTSIQGALYANEHALAEHGVYLPKAGRSDLARKSLNHHNLAWELMESRRFSEAAGGWDDLTAELADVEAETVLLTSEVMGRAVAEADASDELDERLLSLGRDVTVVYAVRDQLAGFNSGYAQLVKSFAEAGDFAEHIELVLERGAGDLEQQTCRWYDSPDFDFVAVPFPTLIESDPLVALLHAARVDAPTDALILGGEPSNITLGPVAVTAFRLLRHYLEGLNPAMSHDDKAVRQLHRVAARSAKAAGWCEEPFWGWTPGLAASALERLAESNERFAQAVWGTPWLLPMPVDRPLAEVARPLDLRGRGLPRVQDFVTAMGKRYVGFVNEEEGK